MNHQLYLPISLLTNQLNQRYFKEYKSARVHNIYKNKHLTKLKRN